MFTFPFGENVTRRRFTDGPLDRYNKPTKIPTETILPQLGAFNPGGSTEPLEADRAPVITSPSLYFTEAPDVTERDELMVRGEWFQVIGTPAVYVSPFDGVTGGVVVTLRRVGG